MFLTVCSLRKLMCIVKEVEKFEDEIQIVLGCSFVLTWLGASSIKGHKNPRVFL